MAPAPKDLILRPGDFFRDLASDPAAYRIPVLIVLIWGILTAVLTFLNISLVMGAFLQAAPHQQGMELMTGIFSVISVMGAVFSLPMAFVYWGVAAFGLYLVSSIFSRTGSISHTATATAWGMIPLVICDAIRIPLFFLYRNAMAVTVSPGFFNLTMKGQANGSVAYAPVSSAELAKYISFSHAFSEYSIISFMIFTLALLGCAWFWFHALQHTRSLTPKQAAITVLVPVVLFLGVMLASRIMSGWA